MKSRRVGRDVVEPKGASAYCWLIQGRGMNEFISADNGAKLLQALSVGIDEDPGDPVAALFKIGTEDREIRYGPREIYEHQLEAIDDAGIIHG